MQGVVIGVTGGLAAGKSTLAAILRRRGAAIYSVDEAAHHLYAGPGPVARALHRSLGPGILDAAGGVDRARLARLVLRDPRALARLERIVHPPLARRARAAVARMARRSPLVVVEAGPLLYRLGLDALADRVALVRCPRAVRLARLTGRRGLGRGEAARRLRVFAPAERALERAARGRRNVVAIRTDGPPAALAAAAARLAGGR